MRTLADMTPEERSHCRGMWGQHRTWGLVIISTTDGIQSRGINVEIIRFLHDVRPIITWEPTNRITPRDDLPRAWQADGQPPLAQYWTIEQAAEYTQISTRSLRRYIADGRLTAYRAGRAIRLKPQDIDTLFTRVEPEEGEQA